MKIIDGKMVASDVKRRLKEETDALAKQGKTCGLAVIIVGEDPASKVYVRNKINSCQEVGIKSFSYAFDADATQEEIVSLIRTLNADDAVDGILVQLPLPKHLNEREILSEIDVKKDVDGFSPQQIGRLLLGESCLPSCTPAGVMELLRHYGVEIEGKRADGTNAFAKERDCDGMSLSYEKFV